MKTGGIGRILIRNLRLRCIIGTNDYERVEKQDVVINVAMSLDISAAAQKDDISDTVNYKLVSSQIVKMVEDSSFYLIETLAEKIAEICLDQPRVLEVTVRVEKPGALKYADSAGVEITRRK